MRASAHVRALMTQKSCAVRMPKAKLGNHLNMIGSSNCPVTGARLQPTVLLQAVYELITFEKNVLVMINSFKMIFITVYDYIQAASILCLLSDITSVCIFFSLQELRGAFERWLHQGWCLPNPD